MTTWGRSERRMADVIARDLTFEHREYSRSDARAMNADNHLKMEIIDGIPEDEAITTYGHGDFEDLCGGPHVESTGRIPAFKLLSVAGSYWRGDENRDRLQRIYGTAFESGRGAGGAPPTAWRRPSAATIASSAASWTCSRYTTRSGRGSSSGTRRARGSGT